MYTPAEESKKKYNVWGSFYNIGPNSFRNSLDIVVKSLGVESLLSNKLDAVVVMLNPGSSSPLNPQKVQPERDIIFTQANPDPAQYQVMSLMNHHKWSHVRILNLSDIREPKSKTFFNKISKIKGHDHSIFSKFRSQEFQSLYNLKKDGYTVLAWTLNPKISNLADLALSKELVNPVGIQHPIFKNLFRYPSPPNFNKKVEWLEEISNRIKRAA